MQGPGIGCSGTLPLSLCEREQLLTSLRVTRDAGEGIIRGQEVRRTGRQQAISVLRTKITSVINLPSCLLILCSSDCYPPQPSLIREGENGYVPL